MTLWHCIGPFGWVLMAIGATLSILGVIHFDQLTQLSGLLYVTIGMFTPILAQLWKNQQAILKHLDINPDEEQETQGR